ncbi:unnamed protein product [Cuscuta campestris]|uniref:Uncharacterized protein n=1 Tax=Cuscuta campestris TaxID=132261 RepID=A0A484MRT6_9ASTE|nr:unnamed protein product [Cuscuta campestris]
MGKSLRSSKHFASFIGSNTFRRRRAQPKVEGSVRVIESASSERRPRMNKKEESSIPKPSSEDIRIPLADVVADCVRRWFQDTLKEAKGGDISMQVLVGQMFCSGYGVPVNAEKGRAWISRASRTRSSAWKVRDKRPGYNVSDSDSDDTAGNAK